MTAFPLDKAGRPVPVQVVNRPLVVDGVDSFLVWVGPRVETWSFDAIRRFVADGLPVGLAS